MMPYYYTLIPKLVSLYFVLQKCSSMYVAVLALLFAVVFEFISWKFHLNLLKKCALALVLIVAYTGIGLCIGIFIERYQIEQALDLSLSNPEMDELKELYKVYKHLDISSEVHSMMSQLATLSDDDKDDTVQTILDRIDSILDNPFLVESEAEALCMTRQVLIDMMKNSISEEEDDVDDLLASLRSIQGDMYIQDILRGMNRCSIVIKSVRVLMEKGSLAAMNSSVNLLTTKEGYIQFKQSVSAQELDVELLTQLIENQEILELLIPKLLEFKIGIFAFLEQQFIVDFIQNYSESYLPKLIQTVEGRQQIMQDLILIDHAINICIDALGNIIEEAGDHKLSVQQVKEKIKICTQDEICQMFKNLGSIEK